LKRSNDTPVFIALIAANLAIIFLAATFLKGNTSDIAVVIILAIAGLGVLGLSVIAMLTSKASSVWKAILGLVVAATIIFSVYLFEQHSDAQVMERHYAVIITEMDEKDVKFAECWFDSSMELKQFLIRNADNWYMGKEGAKDRREMLDYYYTVKAEERENGKTLIDRRNLISAPAQPERAQIIAFVDEYRTGILADASNPVYSMNPIGSERVNEETQQ